jgi:ABC-type dipeptide/oligopeptide/nickel transport system permease subunit
MMRSARTRRRFLANSAARVGVALVSVVVAFAIVGPLLTSHDPFTSDFVHGVGGDQMPVGPCAAFPLGADRLFRDELARLAEGARLSLLIAFASTALASAVGATVGVLAGFYEGTWVDTALMRVVDIGLVFPFLLLVMAVSAALDRTSAWTILCVLGLTGWLGTARVIRAKTMQIRGLDFVTASRALGQSAMGLMIRHIVPNVLGPLLVLATLSIAQMIVAESVLSYIGAGIAPPTPTWGHMLFEGQDYYESAPWLLLAPGVAIVTAILGFNLVGEGLRDALDPRRG